MRSFKLTGQEHLAVDLKRLATVAAGFQIESFLHGVGRFQSFSSEGDLFARGHGFPEGQATSGVEYFDFTVSRSWKTSSTHKEGYSSNFVRNSDGRNAVNQEAADWTEHQQAGLQWKAMTSKLRRFCKK